jgi:two-component system nitrate/nitrite response regulator NarL
MSKPLRLLIVDDSRDFREELASLLSEESYIQKIWMAKHGLEALSLAEKHEPDVVLLDQNMPGLTGAEVARRLKAAKSNALVIFVSADPEAEELAMAAGAEAFFVKGVNTAGLLEALQKAHTPLRSVKRSLRPPRRKK